MLEILVKNRNSSDEKSYKFTQSSIVIGRMRECDVPLDSASVSRKHAKIQISNNHVMISDLGSGNGTRVDQKKLIANEPQDLKPNQKIQIEEFELTINYEAKAPQNIPDIDIQEESLTHADELKPTQASDDMIEIKMIKKVLGALDQDKFASLIVIDEKFEDLKGTFEEGQDEMVIGRDPSCDFHINTSMVSRRHAVIALKWGSYVITDLNSKNGTFVNGEKVTEKSIRDGDEILVGTIKCIFKNPQEFDVDSIAKSLQEENQAKEQINEDLGGPVKKNPTSSFSRKDIEQPEASAEALASLGQDDAPKDSEQKDEPQKDEPQKDDEPKDPNLDESNEKSDDNKPTKKKKSKKEKPSNNQPKAKTPTKKSNLIPKFSPLEWALFGFGALVIVIVLGVMLYLFS